MNGGKSGHSRMARGSRNASTKLRLSDLLEKERRSFRFFYEYDFGDGWHHEVAYEGAQAACAKAAVSTLPRRCSRLPAGRRWFPRGYGDFLKAIRDPQHEEHNDLLEWIGGDFDPDKFRVAAATTAMCRGLPNWREAR